MLQIILALLPLAFKLFERYLSSVGAKEEQWKKYLDFKTSTQWFADLPAEQQATHRQRVLELQKLADEAFNKNKGEENAKN